MVTGHEKVAVMKYIFKQAEPIKGDYSKLKDDYVAKLFRGEISQLPPNLGILTNSLYSSMGSTSTIKHKSEYHDTSKLPQFMYASKEKKVPNMI